MYNINHDNLRLFHQKIKLYIFTIFVILSFTACSSNSKSVDSVNNENKTEVAKPKVDITKNITKFLSNNTNIGLFRDKYNYCDDKEYIYYGTDGKIKKFNKTTSEDSLVTDRKLDSIEQIILDNNNLYFVNCYNNSKYQIYQYDLKNSQEKTIKDLSNEQVSGVKIFVKNNELYYVKDSSISKIALNSQKEELVYSDKYGINNIILDNNTFYYTTVEFNSAVNQLCKYDLSSKTKNVIYSFKSDNIFDNITYSSRRIVKTKDRLFYIGNTSKLMSISKDGGEPQELIKDNVADIVTMNDKIYFINMNDKYRLYSVSVHCLPFLS